MALSLWGGTQAPPLDDDDVFACFSSLQRTAKKFGYYFSSANKLYFWVGISPGSYSPIAILQECQPNQFDQCVHIVNNNRMKHRHNSRVFPNNQPSPKPTTYHLKTSIKLLHIGCGYNFTVVQDCHANIYSFGDNRYGQLGYSNCLENYKELRAVELGKLFEPMGIACGMSHVIVYNKKEAYGWGDHHSGALGYEPTNIVNPAMPRKLPLLIAREERIDDVSCGNNTTVLNISGSFYCVGDNSCRQLGLMFKKPYFEFQKLELQKNNNNTHKVSSQLLKAKTGNRFTIALDSHGTLFGAGELDQFGLALCDDHSSPGGLMVIAKTEDTNSFLEDVADFYCSNNLIIKSKAGQLVKLAGNSTSAFLLKDHLSTEVISDCALCTLIKDKHDTYKWHENVLVKLNKNEEQLIICQQNGCLVVIEHEDETNSEGELSHMREDSCSEQSKEVRQQNQEDNRQHSNSDSEQLSEHPNSPRNSQFLPKMTHKEPKNPHSHSIQYPSKGIDGLTRQVTQQKQIIRLYQIYVSKLQEQNSTLKSKLIQRSLRQIKEDSQDLSTVGFQMLKDLIHRIIKEQQLHKPT